MYHDMVVEKINVPESVIKKSFFIERESIDRYASNKSLIDMEVEKEKNNSMDKIRERVKLANNEIKKEKEKQIGLLNNKIETLSDHKKAAVESFIESYEKILMEILHSMHLSIPTEEKTKYSIKKIISKYNQEESPTLIIRSKVILNNFPIKIPDSWSVKENPEMEGDCQLEIEGGIVQCDFDEIFLEISKELESITF